MTRRGAGRIAGHILGEKPPDTTARIPARQSVYIVRPRVQSESGGSVNRPITVRVDRTRPASLNFSTIPSRPVSIAEEEDAKDLDSPTSITNSVSITEGKDGEVEITVRDQSVFKLMLEDASIEGARYLSAKDIRIRFIWTFIIIVFTILALYQIITQVKMYIETPVATNVEADYPAQINFPTVAICNNNQYRLTYLTGGRVQNRKPRNRTEEIKGIGDNTTNVFDRALVNSWDMDAVKFLRNAAHWKSRMILSCTYPNGTRCRITDFKAVWTLTGLCWAINTDPFEPVMVSGAGPTHALKLLLNVERYERIESCTPRFKTTSLPGLKILIYNQTNVPFSSLDGVNVPPGYTMDIPFRMQHRQKLPGLNCIKEEKKKKGGKEVIEEAQDATTCMIKNYLEEIERQCNCSMRRAYSPDAIQGFQFCNVEEYFNCVVPVLKWGYDDGGFSNYKCMANCDEIDYTAWQDMNELPNNIFPKLIDTVDEEDEEEVDDEENIDDELSIDELGREEHFKCEDNQLLEDQQVSRIKREAHRAYEKQTRYQEDILLRTKRLITRMKQTAEQISATQWGWHNDNFTSVYERLMNYSECYANMSTNHNDIFNAITNKAIRGEERRAKMLVHILSKEKQIYPPPEGEFRTISDVKHVYGGDEVEVLTKKLSFIEEYVHQLHRIYDEDSYNERLSRSLERMSRILQLTDQYDEGKLQRKAWAEKMQARNMRHFFEEDFYEGWYNIITKDLDITIGKNIADLEEKLESLRNLTTMDNGLEIGAVLLFGDSQTNHSKFFSEFLDDMLECTFGDVKNHSAEMSKTFKKVMHDFQSAYTILFKKELPDYLENFEFGNKFIKENFAQVNVFLHKMNVEHWRQDATYSIWSLFCDVGGALGLFLGASLLTIIELIYLCCQYGVTHNKWWSIGHSWANEQAMRMGTLSRETFRRASRRIRKSHSTSSTSSDDEAIEEGGYTLMVPVEHTEKGTKIKLRPKRLRKVPGMIRKSFRRAAKSPNVDVVNEMDEMDLTEIKTSDNELLPTKIPATKSPEAQRRKSPALSVESAPIPGSKSTTPSIISSHSFQPVIIDFGDDSKPDLYAVKQDSDHSKSPPSPNIVFPPPPSIPPPPQEDLTISETPPTQEDGRVSEPPPSTPDLTESHPLPEDHTVSQQGSTPPKDPSPPKTKSGSKESTPTPKNSNSDVIEKQSSV